MIVQVASSPLILVVSEKLGFSEGDLPPLSSLQGGLGKVNIPSLPAWETLSQKEAVVAACPV